jgi:type II secretory pathway pseudopilin PulG
MRFSKPTRAFTLVEVLTVMVLIALMGGMIVTAVQGVTQTAREARTKSIIQTIDSVLMQQYESYKYRALPLDVPDMFQSANFSTSPTSGNAEVGFEVLSTEAARVRLMMVRDLMRMEMPDRLSDISSAPALLRAAASPVVIQGATGQVVATRDNLADRRMFPVRWYDSAATFASGIDNVPSKLAAYRDRIPSTFNFTAPLSLQNQGAECLYMIMATSYVGGTPAIDAIPEPNIGDTDGDGLLEILDGWGQPLGFVRWPAGYFDFELSVNTGIPDDFDLFRSDYAYLDQGTPPTSLAVPTDVNASPRIKTFPWSMKPLVFSVGPDGLSGIATNPWTTAAEDPDFSYQASSWFWPVSAAWYGTELPGRDLGVGTTYSQHPFPDPYLRRFIAANQSGGNFVGLLPGQLLQTPTAAAEVADNLSNYQLQVEQ